MKDVLIHDLELGKVLERDVNDLSGGELRRFAIAVVCVQEADVYIRSTSRRRTSTSSSASRRRR